MTAQVTLLCLPINYPKPIMAKLLNSSSQALEIMLSQHAMHQPITGLEMMLSLNVMQLTLPIKGPSETQEDRDERRVETSLVPQPKLSLYH